MVHHIGSKEEVMQEWSMMTLLQRLFTYMAAFLGRNPIEKPDACITPWTKTNPDNLHIPIPCEGRPSRDPATINHVNYDEFEIPVRCCEVHDHCYEASRHLPACRPVIDYPYINPYRFSCANGQVSCSASSHVCQVSVCECDRVASNCFAQSTYNPKNKHLDPKVHCLS
ncbi:basic phospholipase A2 pseudexin A chain-like isoform X3 [Oncorhynchus nerka]|uniref:basic phospholipase A2 pseudexin A chain-like isoform X3 n=1 Tax=Oncorhynchus nerka TaxID=8023 RepID=UPI0031B84411